jgi:phosphoribosylformylglycinamidine synthase II
MKTKRIEVLQTMTSEKNNGFLERFNLLTGKHFSSIEQHAYYVLQGELNEGELTAKLNQIFCDQAYQILHEENSQQITSDNAQYVVEVGYKPGVTDNTAHAAEEALSLLNISAHVASGKIYVLQEKENIQLTEEDKKVASTIFGNELIQNVLVSPVSEDSFVNRFQEPYFPEVQLAGKGEVETISLDISSEEMEKLSTERCLALRVDEVEAIRDYYLSEDVKKYRSENNLPLWPTDVELEVLAQTWSEHCKHKIFQAEIDYQEYIENPQIPKIGSFKLGGLYKEYIKNTTSRVVEENHYDWLVSVFSDNAGIVDYDENLYVCAKVETHNSPSALDPYGGALTGILGVNRDILGCGMGSRPVANTDIFCFAPMNHENDHPSLTPSNILPPAQILEGVHKGVEDGGNKSGIPTVNGAIYFDSSFAGKPLVFVGTLGVSPKTVEVRGENTAAYKKEVKEGDHIYIVGGAVGADGIHGATFSSLQLDENSPATAVQIGDPITQKRVGDFLVEAQKRGLFSCITDNGAGGISSSVGEMATLTNGAEIDLAKNPLKYPGLLPYEIMISESQERMTVAVPEQYRFEFEELSKKFSVSSVNIGSFNRSGYLKVTYEGNTVGDLNLDFLHDGCPKMKLKAHFVDSCQWMESTHHVYDKHKIEKVDQLELEKIIKIILADPNVASKKPWVQQYDHEVQASTIGKPFIGADQTSPGDAGVVWLYPHGGDYNSTVHTGIGLCPQMSYYDTYLMAQLAVDESIRNIVASGGNPNQVSLLDNFCWPDPVPSEKNFEGEQKLGQLVRACQGLKDACLAYKAPLISGKDSMKNDYKGFSKTGDDLYVSILPTLLVTAVSSGDINQVIDSAFQNTDGKEDHIFLIGSLWGGLTGSVFDRLVQVDNPKYHKLNYPRLDENMKVYEKIHSACEQNLLESCHDISDGGLMTSLLESCFGNDLGCHVDFGQVPGLHSQFDLMAFLFNEAPGRFVVSINSSKLKMFEAVFKGIPKLKIGTVTNDPVLKVKSKQEKEYEIDLGPLKDAWLSLGAQ